MPGFEHELPMSIGLIKLDNGVNIVSQLVDSEVEDIKINANVKAVFRKINADGNSGQILEIQVYLFLGQAYGRIQKPT